MKYLELQLKVIRVLLLDLEIMELQKSKMGQGKIMMNGRQPMLKVNGFDDFNPDINLQLNNR